MISVHNFCPLATAMKKGTRTQTSNRIRAARHFGQRRTVKKD